MGHEFRMAIEARRRNLPFHHGASGRKPIFSWRSFVMRILMWLLKEPRLQEYIELGRFRLGGEVHQWMYDRYSLRALLEETGFIEVLQIDAYTSMIESWDRYQWLDVEESKVRKPDSIFLEGKKVGGK
jgi:hypothetical protein